MDQIKENYISAEKLWAGFLDHDPHHENKELPVSFYFCDNEKDADECAEWVVQGIKQATATSLWWYEKNNEPLPETGTHYIVTDWQGNARAIIKTTKIELVPYNEISAEFAATEGEGEKTLEYWKRVHEAYYRREMEAYGDKFDENMIIVCEYFTKVYPE